VRRRVRAGAFFTAHEAGTRSDYTYFSFVTMATVGYGDLTAAGGIGRALAVTEGLLGQIYLVTSVAPSSATSAAHARP
jgi:voltage-gated potassium channel Kch